MKRAVVVAAILVTAAVRPAAAEEEDKRDEDAYWSAALVGGLLVPTGDLNVAHQTGLIAGGRVGWISHLGLGVEVEAAYSPLPRKPSDTETARGHFGVATVGPRYTLGRKRWRGTAVLAGGAAFERTRVRGTNAEIVRTFAPVVGGGGRIEVFVSSETGLVLDVGYTQQLGDDGGGFVDVTGGLVMTF